MTADTVAMYVHIHLGAQREDMTSQSGQVVKVVSVGQLTRIQHLASWRNRETCSATTDWCRLIDSRCW